MVYGEEKGRNRGPGAKVERKQVDNDNSRTIHRIPQPFIVHTFHDFPTFQQKTQPSLHTPMCVAVVDVQVEVHYREGNFRCFQGKKYQNKALTSEEETKRV